MNDPTGEHTWPEFSSVATRTHSYRGASGSTSSSRSPGASCFRWAALVVGVQWVPARGPSRMRSIVRSVSDT